MYRLRAVPKSDDLLPEGPPATIGVGVDGGLQIHCDDDATYDWVASLLSDRLFVQGSGFPKLQRDAGGHLVRSPETHRYVVTDYVDLAGEPDDLLQAIEDNLEATDSFVLSRIVES